jgi:hypothetical protein
VQKWLLVRLVPQRFWTFLYTHVISLFQIIARLSTESEMARFHSYVEKKDPETLSAREIQLAFPPDSGLLDVVELALGPDSQDAKPSAEVAVAAVVAALPAEPSESAAGTSGTPVQLLQQSSLVRKTARCLLPQLDALYTSE